MLSRAQPHPLSQEREGTGCGYARQVQSRLCLAYDSSPWWTDFVSASPAAAAASQSIVRVHRWKRTGHRALEGARRSYGEENSFQQTSSQCQCLVPKSILGLIWERDYTWDPALRPPRTAWPKQTNQSACTLCREWLTWWMPTHVHDEFQYAFEGCWNGEIRRLEKKSCCCFPLALRPELCKLVCGVSSTCSPQFICRL